ncbi:radical SAM protein [candidate division KSB1 bacterium]|nr:radical SAM protein [candidate division KSB1 bacterium]
MSTNTKKGSIKKVIIKEIEAKSILRKHKKIDSWFVCRYGMNLYRGCVHDCTYCDGRAEKYQVEGEFGKEVVVKTNAIEILKRELDPSRKRKPMKRSAIGIGGGVGDSYQPIEKKYQLTRQTLQLISYFNSPVFVLTKSTMVERDIDILQQINKQSRAIICFSFSSANEKISKIFEPGVPSPQERFETIKKFKSLGFACGVYLMPVIPFITDTPQIMEDTIQKAKEAGVDFIVFSGMTLKEGRQKKYFFDVLKKHYPDLLPEYNNIYRSSQWGQATKQYYDSIHRTFFNIIKEYQIPPRIPPYLFSDILDENDLVIVLLEHIDYMLKLMGRTSPFGFAAYSISQLKVPLSSIRGELQKLKGVGQTTERIIFEILDTGRSEYYERLFTL